MSEWANYSIADMGLVVTGSTPSTKAKRFWDGEVPFYSPADFDGSILCTKTEKTVTEEALSFCRPIPVNAIMFTCITSVGKIAISSKCGVTNQQINSIIPFPDAFDYKFVYYILSYYRSIFENYAPQTTIPIINKGDFQKFSFIVPKDINEQRKIAEILSTVDDVIEKTEAAIEKYQAIKAGMMQDLFTRGIDTRTGMLRPRIEEAPELYKESELGWIPKEWEIVQIGDFAKIKGGKRMPAGKEFSEALTPFPYLRVTDMQDGSIDQSDLKYVPVEIEPLIRSYKISVDDVYVTIAGTLGLFGTIPVNLDQAQLTENAARITEFDKFEYDRDFIKHQCNSAIVQGQVIREIGVGGGVPKLALFRIAKFLFLKPAIPEQQAIVDRIRVIECKISEESITLKKYKQIKQGLMADLLSGSVRIKIDI